MSKFRNNMCEFINQIVTVNSDKNCNELYLLKNYLNYIASDIFIEDMQKTLIDEIDYINSKDSDYFIKHKVLRNWLSQFISENRLDELINDIWINNDDDDFKETFWMWLKFLSKKE